MHPIKKALRITGMALLGIIIFLLAFLAVAYAASHITVNKNARSNKQVTIYIMTNGVHTDVVVPVHSRQVDWSSEVKFSNTTGADTASQYLAMGWGDKGFYLETPRWSDLKASTAFKAAFGLSTTAIHATYYSTVTESKTCRKIEISEQQYASLIAYIMASFQKDGNGHIMAINTKANYGNSDAFYEANGRYSMLHTCNTWANNALKISGQPCCLWSIFDTPIFDKYRAK